MTENRCFSCQKVGHVVKRGYHHQTILNILRMKVSGFNNKEQELFHRNFLSYRLGNLNVFHAKRKGILSKIILTRG